MVNTIAEEVSSHTLVLLSVFYRVVLPALDVLFLDEGFFFERMMRV